MRAKYNIRWLGTGLILLILLCEVLPAAGKRRKKLPEPPKTAYERLFADETPRTVRGLFTLHLLDGDVYLEIPDSLLGRDLLLGVTVLSVSDGEESSVGMQPSQPRHVVFQRTDSLLQIATIDSRSRSDDPEIGRALAASRQPSVIASFPIKAMTPDSCGMVVCATSFFRNGDSYLSPKDPQSYSSRDGLFLRSYEYRSEASYIRDVAAFADNVSVMSELSYEVSSYAFGVIARGDPELFTATVRTSFLLLPEAMNSVRKADPRVGTATSRYVEYAPEGQGAEVCYYASRWRVDAGHPIVFYLDDRFPASWKPYIERGVLTWNDAFAKIGLPQAIEVRHVSAEGLPDVNDIRYSAVRYVPSPARDLRCNVWTDPRTGEILSANIYISHNVGPQIQTERLLQSGAVDPRTRHLELDEALFGESLQAKVAHYAGLCLGLLPNGGASQVVPVDSLRSVHFTNEYGLSASILDEVPLNYVARSEDFRRGVRLCQTTLGPYDYRAVEWLYGNGEVSDDPSCRFLQLRSGKFALDPRSRASDLGDDPLRAAEAGLANLDVVLRNVSEWIDDEDRDYAYRSALPESVSFYCNALFAPVIARLGGVLIHERRAGDAGRGIEPLPAETQREAMRWLLRQLDELKWLDNPSLIVGEGLNPGVADFVRVDIFDRILQSLDRIALCASLSDGATYTRAEAMDDLSNYLWSRSDPSDENFRMLLQRRFLDRLLALVGEATGRKSTLRSDYFDQSLTADDSAGFAPLSGVSYLTRPEDGHLLYGVLLDSRARIESAAARSSSPQMRGHCAWMLRRVTHFLENRR